MFKVLKCRILVLALATFVCNGNFDQRTLPVGSEGNSSGTGNDSDSEITSQGGKSPVSVTGTNLFDLETAELFCSVSRLGLLSKLNCQPAIKVDNAYITAGLQFSPDITQLKWKLDGSRWTIKASGTCVALKGSAASFGSAVQCIYEGLPTTAKFTVELIVSGKDGKVVSRSREIAATNVPQTMLLAGNMATSTFTGNFGQTAYQFAADKPVSAGSIFIHSRVSETFVLGQPTVESIFSLTPSNGQIAKKEVFRKEGLLAEFAQGFEPSSAPSIDEESRVLTRNGNTGATGTCAQTDYLLDAQPYTSVQAQFGHLPGEGVCSWNKPHPVRARTNGDLFHVTIYNGSHFVTQTTSDYELWMTSRKAGETSGTKILLDSAGPSAAAEFVGSVWGSFLIVGGSCGNVGEFQLLEAYIGKQWQITCRGFDGKIDPSFASQGRITLPQSYEAMQVGNALSYERGGHSIFKLDGKLFIPMTKSSPVGNSIFRRLPDMIVVDLQRGQAEVIAEPFGSNVDGYPKIWIGNGGEILALVRIGSSDGLSPVDLRRYHWTGSKLELKEERRLPWQSDRSMSDFPFGMATMDGQALVRYELLEESVAGFIASLHLISFQ